MRCFYAALYGNFMLLREMPRKVMEISEISRRSSINKAVRLPPCLFYFYFGGPYVHEDINQATGTDWGP